MSRIEVVYTASRNIYPYLPASFMSLLDYNPDARVWMLIEDDELPYEVPENIEVVNVRGQTIFGTGCPNWNTPFTYMSLIRVAYSKLFTGEPNEFGVRTLPKLDRILQLDVDTIVQDDLTPVWETDLTGKWFAMVPQRPAIYRPWGPRKYYNAGVAVFNLEQIRLDRADDELIELINELKMQFIDEMAWNKLNNDNGDSKGVDLHYRWNQNTEVRQTLDVGVMHYAGTKIWYKDFDKLYRPYYVMKYAMYFQKVVNRP
jgi:Lipopolysaccharide biosynthesis proteins, LPS:glycosyltransferases